MHRPQAGRSHTVGASVTGLPRIGRVAGVFLAMLVSSPPGFADSAAAPPSPSCATSPELSAIEAPLDRSESRVRAGKSLTVVAIGSSSTQGVGASAPGMSYPTRLEQELRERYPGLEVRVINRGVSGQDV